jgi:hypothetical protein
MATETGETWISQIRKKPYRKIALDVTNSSSTSIQAILRTREIEGRIREKLMTNLTADLRR